LAHRGPCTAQELARPVTVADVEQLFSIKVAEAERVVRKRVLRQQLNQAQFDALVSYTFNAGQRGAESALAKVDKGDFKSAAADISATVYMTVKTKKGTKRVLARGLVSRRAEESAPFRSPPKLRGGGGDRADSMDTRAREGFGRGGSGIFRGAMGRGRQRRLQNPDGGANQALDPGQLGHLRSLAHRQGAWGGGHHRDVAPAGARASGQNHPHQ